MAYLDKIKTYEHIGNEIFSAVFLKKLNMVALKKVDDPKKAWRSITLNLDPKLSAEKGLLKHLKIRGNDVIPAIKLVGGINV